jgi:uncharacterized membrane protein (UPF0127 family)
MVDVTGTLRKGVFTLVIAAIAALALSTAGCREETDADVARVKVKGESFYAEVAAKDATRMRGLGGRDHIEDDGGMIFVFPRAERRQFVMRDCLVPIDIAFLDGSGRVLTTYTMPIETPRQEGESDMDYENRLERYSSRFPCEFVLELKAGTLERLGVEEGDLVQFDVAGLKARLD